MSEIDGMRQAAHSMRYWEVRQQVVANNLANVSTDGFKGERVFARLLGDAIPIAEAATDFTPGTLRTTGQPLDLALEGAGFFVIETPEGERFSRGGSFTIDDQGRLTDGAGNLLLGESGPIEVRTGTIEIDRFGQIRVDGAAIDRIRVEVAPDGVKLQHAGGNLFIPGEEREILAPDERGVRQGAIEDSNVSSVGAMVDMISIQRAYSAVQRAVQTLDGVRGTISSEIGKPI